MARHFRRRGALHSWEMHFGPNMTPMVDVVMVILIFFMASATFAGAEWFLRTGLPKEEAERALSGDTGDPFKLPPARFEITLSRGGDGRTVVTGQGFAPTPLEGLGEQLRALAAGTGADDLVLVIRSNGDVAYGDVIRAHSEAAGAGIGKVGLMDAGG